MQEDDLAVPNLRENAVDPCLNAGFRDPVLTAGAADEGQIHLIKERIADGDVGWAEERSRSRKARHAGRPGPSPE